MKFKMILKYFVLCLVQSATNFISFPLGDDYRCYVDRYFVHLKGCFDKISDNPRKTLFSLLCEILPYFHKHHYIRIAYLRMSRFHKIFDILVAFNIEGCHILLTHITVHANQS